MAPSNGKEMLNCPMCPFEDEDFYALTHHVDVVHFGGSVESEAAVTQQNACDDAFALALAQDNDDETGKNDRLSNMPGSIDMIRYVLCPENDCGEQVQWRDYQQHLDFHSAEHLTLDDSLSSADMYAYTSAYYSHPSLSYFGLPASSFQIPLDAPALFENDVRQVNAYFLTSSDGQWQSISPDLERFGLSRRDRHASQPRRRFGIKELGPYAFEDRMPDMLYKLLLTGGKTNIVNRLGPDGRLYKDLSIENETSGIVPLLATLLNADTTVERAWLCHSAVQHIFKLPKEGGFCGYRNIQMLLSFMLGAKWPGYERMFRQVKANQKAGQQRVPGILDLQEMIEKAWDSGSHPHARIQTGGIKGTRKWIGTPEAGAFLELLRIPYKSFGITDVHFPTSESDSPGQSIKAHDQLFHDVEQYFTQNEIETAFPKVIQTDLPPIYLQEPGHSLTIVGMEIRKSGQRDLIVLDPAYKTNPAIAKLLEARPGSPSKQSAKISRKRKVDDSSSSNSWSSGYGDKETPEGKQANKLLHAFRRGGASLRRFREFELLMLDTVKSAKKQEAESDSSKVAWDDQEEL